ncbi:MAG: protein YgfX [Hyphomicrobiaceae bacterium]
MREIELKPSRRLGLLLLGMTALALAAIALAGVRAEAAFALGLAAIGLGAWGWRQGLPVGGLRIAADGRLQCLDDMAEWRDAEVLDESFVSTGLIVLRYRPADRGARTLTLLPDSAGSDDLRRLRVSLRWARRTRSDTGFPGAG